MSEMEYVRVYITSRQALYCISVVGAFGVLTLTTCMELLKTQKHSDNDCDYEIKQYRGSDRSLRINGYKRKRRSFTSTTTQKVREKAGKVGEKTLA